MVEKKILSQFKKVYTVLFGAQGYRPGSSQVAQGRHAFLKPLVKRLGFPRMHMGINDPWQDRITTNLYYSRSRWNVKLIT
jgi:hypothetical protein